MSIKIPHDVLEDLFLVAKNELINDLERKAKRKIDAAEVTFHLRYSVEAGTGDFSELFNAPKKIEFNKNAYSVDTIEAKFERRRSCYQEKFSKKQIAWGMRMIEERWNREHAYLLNREEQSLEEQQREIEDLLAQLGRGNGFMAIFPEIPIPQQPVNPPAPNPRRRGRGLNLMKK